MLLRLDLPEETEIAVHEYATRSLGVKVVVSAPKRVHDGIAPLVDLLVADRASREKAKNAEIRRAIEKRRPLPPDTSKRRDGRYVRDTPPGER